MSKERKTIYIPHPVSPELKAKLRAEGYKIIDARFAPVDHLRDDGPTVAEYVAAGYLPAGYPPKGYASRSTEDEIADAIAAHAAAQPINPTVEQRSEGAAQGGQIAGFDPAIQPAGDQTLPVDDGLGQLSAEQLHELAKERGVKVHHAAGADKVREALREAQGE